MIPIYIFPLGHPLTAQANKPPTFDAYKLASTSSEANESGPIIVESADSMNAHTGSGD